MLKNGKNSSFNFGIWNLEFLLLEFGIFGIWNFYYWNLLRYIQIFMRL
jgi:hypothetical protein